jgi:hypothetical protein
MAISFVFQIRDNRPAAIKTLFKHGGGRKACSHLAEQVFVFWMKSAPSVVFS